MCLAPAIRRTQTRLKKRTNTSFAKSLNQLTFNFAFKHRNSPHFPYLKQIINVPETFFLPSKMSSEPLINAFSGPARINVPSLWQRNFTQCPNPYLCILIEPDQQKIAAGKTEFGHLR